MIQRVMSFNRARVLLCVVFVVTKQAEPLSEVWDCFKQAKKSIGDPYDEKGDFRLRDHDYKDNGRDYHNFKWAFSSGRDIF